MSFLALGNVPSIRRRRRGGEKEERGAGGGEALVRVRESVEVVVRV